MTRLRGIQGGERRAGLAEIETRMTADVADRGEARAASNRAVAEHKPASTSSPEGPPPAARPRRGACLGRGERAQGGLRRLCAQGRGDGRWSTSRRRRCRRLRPRRRLSRARRDRDGDRPAASPGHVADPRHRRACARSRRPSTRSRSPSPAPRPAGSARRRRGRETAGADARRAAVSGHGALRHAGGDADAARRAAVDIDQWIADEVQTAFAEQESDGLRHRQRHQQAEGLPRLYQGRGRAAGPGANRLHRDRRRRRLRGQRPLRTS